MMMSICAARNVRFGLEIRAGHPRGADQRIAKGDEPIVPLEVARASKDVRP